MNDTSPITVHPTVRAYLESLGAPGRAWLDALPAAVEEQRRAWSLLLDETLPGGSRSYLRRATTADGERAVLKLAYPEPILETQIATLAAARGRGYVRLLAHDTRRGALLLESLGPPIGETDDVTAVLTLTADTLMQAWQVPSEGLSPRRDGAEHKAAGLLALVSDLSGYAAAPFRPAVEQALGYARERLGARDLARQVVVHGDPHAENLLRVERARPGAETGCVLVDPEGFPCEPEYDLGVALRGWNTRLLASTNPQGELRAWCEQVAYRTGTEAEAVWQWAYLERVSTGLYLHHHGLPHLGAPFLEVARRLVAR